MYPIPPGLQEVFPDFLQSCPMLKLKVPWACYLLGSFCVSLKSLGHIHMATHTLSETQGAQATFRPCMSTAVSTLLLIHNHGASCHLPGQGTGPLHSQMPKLNRSSLCAFSRHTHICKVASMGVGRWGHNFHTAPSYLISPSALLSPLRVRVSPVGSEVGRLRVERRQGKWVLSSHILFQILPLSIPREGLLRLCS